MSRWTQSDDGFRLLAIFGIGLAAGGFISWLWTDSIVAARFIGTGLVLLMGAGAARIVWWR